LAGAANFSRRSLVLLASDPVPDPFPVIPVPAYLAEPNNLALAVPGGEARGLTENPVKESMARAGRSVGTLGSPMFTMNMTMIARFAWS